MTPAAQAHRDVKKADRIAFSSIVFLFVAAAAGMGFFAALMVAIDAVLFYLALVLAVQKENRPEVSFKGDDFRACFYFSGSAKKTAAAKQANN